MNPPLNDTAARYKSSLAFGTGWLWLLLLAALLWLFSPGLFQSQIPAFRDAYHFYYPQAVWLDRCAEQGNYFPVWNPNEGLGVSLAGQPSAALYYPLRMLWWVPGLSVPQSFSLFSVAHLLLAAGGMLYATRRLQLTKPAQWLAAISFGLSCPVFFQHHNLIYLSSAAWIGFACGAVVGPLLQAQYRIQDALILAAACSLMLLAGDPHTAVNTFLMALLIPAIHFLVHRFGLAHATLQPVSIQRPPWLAAGMWLFVSVVLFIALTSVQWIPAWRQSQLSSRALPAPQATQAERGAERGADAASALLPQVSAILASSPPSSHRIYDFSLSPWHLATTIWPTLGGDYVPRNSRIFAALPAESRMWIPALYFGCIPCLLMLSALIKKKTPTMQVLFISATFTWLAALGSYTPVWLLRELLSSLGLRAWAAQLPLDPVSGVYWLLCSMIPSYAMFRYPAKWTVWLVALCCLIAAQFYSDSSSQVSPLISKRLRRTVQIVSLLGLGLSASVWWLAFHSVGFEQGLAQAAPDSWLGPPNARAVAFALTIAFAIPVCVLWLKINSGYFALLTLAEMTLCASCWISFLPPPAMNGLNDLPESVGNARPTYLWADSTEADFVRDVASDVVSNSEVNYASTQATYQQSFALGKLASLSGVRNLNAAQSLEPAPLTQLRSWLSRQDQMTVTQPALDQVLSELGVTHRLVRRRLPHRSAEFHWQPVKNPQPLCQLLNADRELKSVNEPIPSTWRDSNTLHVNLPATAAVFERPRLLLIRQLNDGGWKARTETGQDLSLDPASLFLVIHLTGAEKQVQLTRKWLW
jgi:hypothetical protein